MLLFVVSLGTIPLLAQGVPPSSSKVWHSKAEQSIARDLAPPANPPFTVDTAKVYTLPELIDLAEQHNPETRVAWQIAKTRAAALGVARSALYPTIAATAVANTSRVRILFGSDFFRQTYGVFEPQLHLEYLIFDFGERGGAIDAAKANLMGADFAFNDTHRKIIFQVAAAYYRLLNELGQQSAAEASLKNARAVQEDTEDRLTHGLATKPDALEAEAATAQAEYDLQAVLGAEEIARGDLATVLGLPPETPIQVQNIEDLSAPLDLMDSVDKAVDRAFQQRPDFKVQVARLRAAEAGTRQARSAYFPTLGFSGSGGLQRQFGQQADLPPGYVSGETWNVSLGLKWTVFDGGRREHEIAQAAAEKRAAQAEVDTLRDGIANEVWAAYSNVKTAQRQRQAAQALLASASQSYAAARESYQYGVRNLLDVVSAQKVLAQASSVDIYTRTQLLLQLANLAFRTGDLVQTPSRPTP
ncbi:MAG TPA: TolC family protein [Acidisarcina sp.]|nr:TolC family protein [Acidisarcina sp.]